jgi:hypothetical protein
MSNDENKAGVVSDFNRELGFKLEAGTVTFDDAVTCADELENFIGGVLNGKLKAKNLPIEPLAKLVQFARDVVKKEQQSDALSKAMIEAIESRDVSKPMVFVKT